MRVLVQKCRRARSSSLTHTLWYFVRRGYLLRAFCQVLSPGCCRAKQSTAGTPGAHSGKPPAASSPELSRAFQSLLLPSSGGGRGTALAFFAHQFLCCAGSLTPADPYPLLALIPASFWMDSSSWLEHSRCISSVPGTRGALSECPSSFFRAYRRRQPPFLPLSPLIRKCWIVFDWGIKGKKYE